VSTPKYKFVAVYLLFGVSIQTFTAYTWNCSLLHNCNIAILWFWYWSIFYTFYKLSILNISLWAVYYTDWRVRQILICSITPWEWHRGAETCRGLILVMNCILLSEFVGGCTDYVGLQKSAWHITANCSCTAPNSTSFQSSEMWYGITGYVVSSVSKESVAFTLEYDSKIFLKNSGNHPSSHVQCHVQADQNPWYTTVNTSTLKRNCVCRTIHTQWSQINA
jgi:hypothetical protein